MNERTCVKCRKQKRISEFEGVSGKPPDVCYACWQKVIQERKYGAGHSPYNEGHASAFVIESKMILLAILVVVVIVGGVLIHKSNPCNNLSPADHKVMEYVERSFGSVSLSKISESTGLSMMTIYASAQRLEECGRITAS